MVVINLYNRLTQYNVRHVYCKPIIYTHLHGISVANFRRASKLGTTAEKSYTSNISQTTDSNKLIFQQGNFTAANKVSSLSLLHYDVVVMLL
jgi:hypothetical protein